MSKCQKPPLWLPPAAAQLTAVAEAAAGRTLLRNSCQQCTLQQPVSSEENTAECRARCIAENSAGKVQRAADSAVQSILGWALTLLVLVNSQQLGVLAPSVNYRHSAGSRTTAGQIAVKSAGQSTGQSAIWIAGDLKGRM